MFTKNVIIILLLFFINYSSFCQEKEISDSLLHVLKTVKLTDKAKIKLLSKLAYKHPSPIESLNFAKQSLALAIDLNDELLQAAAWEEISHVERRLGNNSKSFDASLKALTIYEKKKLTDRQAASYAQIASNYISDENYPTAIKFLKKSEIIYQKHKDKMKYALTLINLGEAYRLSGILDSATINFKKAIAINNTQDNDVILGYASGNLGMVYAEEGKNLLAKPLLEESISILTKLGDPYSTSVYLSEIGNVYRNDQNYKIAEEKYLESLNIAKAEGLKEQIRDVSASLSTLYEEQKLYKKALSYKKQFQVYQDSLVNKKNVQQIEQLKAGYEIGKREVEISRIGDISANRKNLAIVLSIGISILGFFLYLLYRGNKKMNRVNHILQEQKDEISAREKEKALLLRELNHRVKNNLQMVSSLLRLQSNELSGHPAKEALVAGQYRVEALSLVHRKLYQEGVESMVQLKEYVEELVLGLFYSYGLTFTPKFDIQLINIKVDIAVPLALIINELVTNSIKYAYSNNDNPSLSINIRELNNQLIIDIIDNGIGFSKEEKEKSNSFGIKLVSSLIEQLGGEMKLMEHNGTHWKLIL